MNQDAITLSPEQLGALKADILAELRRETASEPNSRYSLGAEIKKLTFPVFGKDYQIQSAISTILRKTFNKRHQTFFSGSDLDAAVQMATELVSVIWKYRKDGDNANA